MLRERSQAQKDTETLHTLTDPQNVTDPWSGQRLDFGAEGRMVVLRARGACGIEAMLLKAGET